MQTEVTALTTQINNVLTNTQFNGDNLFDGTAGTAGAVTIQAGANASDTVTLTFGNLKGNAALSATAGVDRYRARRWSVRTIDDGRRDAIQTVINSAAPALGARRAS